MKQIINLNGTWQLREEIEKNIPPLAGDWIDVQVPGNIESSLSKCKILPDNLYYGKNLLKAKCTESRCWWYRKKFIFNSTKRDEVNLVFNGLDLFTVVYFNGQEIGQTANMFRQYKFDVRDLIRDGENEICVKFLSTKKEVDKLLKKYPDYWTIFYPGSTLVRKAQCHFGWDWAPEMITQGIWEDVYVENYRHNTINDVFVETQIDGQLCFRVRLNSVLTGKTLRVAATDGREEGSAEAESLRLRRSLAGKTIKVIVKDKTKKWTAEASTTGVNNFVNLKLDNPRLWWPIGIGEPNLYDYCVQLLDRKKIIDSYSGRFGIRQIDIDEQIISNERTGFTLKVNNIPVFCKGANWVPTDCFPGQTTDETYKRLIKNAVDANFNIIRVWGGGIYEKNAFYEECDKQGIMIWQDFANSCGHPPDDHMWYLDNVLAEAEYQIKRLRNHPCIILWCGGNESSNPWFFSENPPGKKLLRYYLRGMIGDLSAHTPYICSSPHSKSDLGGEPTSGDTHGSSWPRKAHVRYADFRDRISGSTIGFSSEIALIGPSPMESLEKCLSKDDLFPISDTAVFHFSKHPDPEQTPSYAVDQLRMANELIGECTSAEQFINYAMMAHSEMVSEEIRNCRARKFENSGAMLWMFNECWPNSNWAIVDYYGYKKPAYYAAKRAFSPVAVAVRKTGKTCTVVLLNDMLKNIKCTIDVSCRDSAGNIFWHKTFKCGGPANGVFEITKITADSLRKKNAFLRIVCKYGNKTDELNYFPQLWKDVAFEKAILDSNIISKNKKIADGYETKVAIRSKNYARFVYVNVPGMDIKDYSIDDNYFDLIHGQKKTVTLYSKTMIDTVTVDNLLNVRFD